MVYEAATPWLAKSTKVRRYEGLRDTQIPDSSDAEDNCSKAAKLRFLNILAPETATSALPSKTKITQAPLGMSANQDGTRKHEDHDADNCHKTPAYLSTAHSEPKEAETQR